MSTDTITYLVFGAVLLVALLFDLGLLSKKNKTVTIKQALLQTIFWVVIGLGFCGFLWFEEGSQHAVEYISAYLMEWSLSIDNIFVFILIFTSFGVQEKHYSRVLLAGIIMAVIFRVIFISVGVALVTRFEWLLYIFGVFLLITGVRMFAAKEDDKFDPKTSKIYLFLKKFLPLTSEDGDGHYMVEENGKRKFTTLFIVVIILASIDIVFALDSIPAVMGISRDKLVIYTSNILAVLGLRSLFFLLKGAVAKFKYLQQGIAIVLVFIGVKMLAEHWVSQWLSSYAQVIISLAVILICISGSIIYSNIVNKRETQA